MAERLGSVSEAIKVPCWVLIFNVTQLGVRQYSDTAQIFTLSPLELWMARLQRMTVSFHPFLHRALNQVPGARANNDFSTPGADPRPQWARGAPSRLLSSAGNDRRARWIVREPLAIRNFRPARARGDEHPLPQGRSAGRCRFWRLRRDRHRNLRVGSAPRPALRCPIVARRWIRRCRSNRARPGRGRTTSRGFLPIQKSRSCFISPVSMSRCCSRPSAFWRRRSIAPRSPPSSPGPIPTGMA